MGGMLPSTSYVEESMFHIYENKENLSRFIPRSPMKFIERNMLFFRQGRKRSVPPIDQKIVGFLAHKVRSEPDLQVVKFRFYVSSVCRRRNLPERFPVPIARRGYHRLFCSLFVFWHPGDPGFSARFPHRLFLR